MSPNTDAKGCTMSLSHHDLAFLLFLQDSLKADLKYVANDPEALAETQEQLREVEAEIEKRTS